MSNELKPCPFCGGEVNVCFSSKKGYYVIHSLKHGESNECILPSGMVLSRKYENLGQAYEAWNRRANDDKN